MMSAKLFEMQQNFIHFFLVRTSFMSKSKIQNGLLLKPIYNYNAIEEYGTQVQSPTNLQRKSSNDYPLVQNATHQLKKMKQKINKLYHQTEQLAQRKKDFSSESKEIEKSIKSIKSQNVIQLSNPSKLLINNNKIKPIKDTESQVSFSQKPPGSTIEQKKLNCISPRSEKHERMGKTLKSLNLQEFQQQTQSRRKTLIFRKDSRINPEKSNTPSQLREKFELIFLERENSKLKEEVKMLNASRQYYQKQLIKQLQKQKQLEKECQRKIEEKKDEYKQIINQYLDTIEEKNKQIEGLQTKSKNENTLTERLSMLTRKVEQLTAQNEQLAEKLQNHVSDHLQLPLKTLEVSYTQTIKNLQAQLSACQKKNKQALERHTIEVLKFKAESKKIKTSLEIDLQNQVNKIQQLQHKLKTLESKYNYILGENSKKDHFIQKFIRDKSQENIDSVLNNYQEELKKHEFKEQELIQQVIQLEKKTKLYQTL